jgi:hypothetical protein
MNPCKSKDGSYEYTMETYQLDEKKSGRRSKAESRERAQLQTSKTSSFAAAAIVTAGSLQVESTPRQAIPPTSARLGTS